MSNLKKFILAFCITVAALAAFYIVYHTATDLQKKKDYEAIAASTAAVETPAPTETPTVPPEPTETPVEIPVDFATWQKRNSDVYAWITVPDTVIDYPILQHPTDDSFYLNCNIDKVYETFVGRPGTIYTELWNSKDFSDFNTVIYGHDMDDGTMFGALRKFRDSDYLDAHREIIIYTPTEKRVYKVFAAVVYSDAYLPYAFDMNTAEGARAYLQSLRDTRNLNSKVYDDITVDENSHILTLSTCVYGQPSNRYLVGAVYVGDQ